MEFVRAEDFLPLLPIPLTRSRAFYWSRRGRFPRAYRFISQKSEPLFAVLDLVKWTRATFADMPSEVTRIEAALKETAQARAKALREQAKA